MRFAARSVGASLSLAALALSSCVAYRAAPVSAPTLAAAAPTPDASVRTFEGAVRWAVEHNPDLKALRHRVRAVNLEPPAEPIGVAGERDMAGARSVMLSLDALSLLGLGPRAADRVLARARRDEAVLRHHERAREVAGEVAESFAVARALASLSSFDTRVEAEAYVRAGLETGAAQTAVEATERESVAEAASRAAEARANDLALRRLLGARPDAPLAIDLPAEGWPAVPAPAPEALFAARADLQSRLAAYETADAEFRRAVAGQWPGLEVEPAITASPAALFGAVRLRLPVGADREAVAALSAREAAREEVASAVLDALRDAEAARAEASAADERFAAARARMTASDEIFRTAKARLDAGTGMLLDAVFAAREVVMAAGDLRMAAVEAARARVKAARAAGWPGPEVVR